MQKKLPSNFCNEATILTTKGPDADIRCSTIRYEVTDEKETEKRLLNESGFRVKPEWDAARPGHPRAACSEKNTDYCLRKLF